MDLIYLCMFKLLTVCNVTDPYLCYVMTKNYYFTVDINNTYYLYNC